MSALKRHRVAIVVVVLLAVIGVLTGLRVREQQARAVPRPRGEILVGVVAPVPRDIEVKIASTADILATQQAAIFSKVSGYIRRLHVDRGDLVQTGQLLAEIDDQELQAQLGQARAGVLTQEAGLGMAQSTLDGQRANLENQRAALARARAVAANDARQAERMKALFERGLVSETDWDNARTAATSSQASVEAAEAQLRLAATQIGTSESQVRLAQAQVATSRASLQLAESNLSNTRILAPFTGYIAQRNLDAGAAVSAASSGTNTSSLGILLLQAIDSVKVQVDVPDRHVSRVTVGVPVRLTVDPLRDEIFEGKVGRVVPSLDPRSRTMGVEVEIPNPGKKLKPGMFARVELVVERRTGALAIPAEALRLGEAAPTVMVVRSGQVELAKITLGVSDGNWVEVARGLADKDQVIVQGKDLVRPGQKVRTTPATGLDKTGTEKS